jgi:hypothetical protein
MRYFTIGFQIIEIFTPENRTYTAPMSGYYPATYGFENDTIGSIPEGWDFYPHHGYGNGYITANRDGHEKVLVIEDVSTSAYPEIFQTFTPQTSGTVEFYMQKGAGPSTCIITLYDSVDQAAVILNIDEGDNGEFQYVGSGDVYIPFTAGLYSDNTWFHIRIDFNTQSDTFNVYLNSQLVLSNINFYLPVSSIEKIRFGSNYAYTGVFYVDAVGYSWDPNYNVGDNLNEGLLLSFETVTPLEWMAYYLDDSPNHTIYGNTVIPMPSIGVHSIKVIGLDSLDEIHQSSWRIFSIDYQQPTPPDTPPYDNFPIIMFTIIGTISMVGTILATILIVIKPRKFYSKNNSTSLRTEERYYQSQSPIRENIPPSRQSIQCPHCLQWDEIGGNYCPNCGGKIPNAFKNY